MRTVAGLYSTARWNFFSPSSASFLSQETDMLIKKLIFLIILLASCGSSEPDFYTRYGTQVFVGEINKPTKESLELWTQTTIEFWTKIFPKWAQCFEGRTSYLTAHFLDEDYILWKNRKFSGLAKRSSTRIYVSSGNPYKVRTTFIHELSHIYLGDCGGFWDNDRAHFLFDGFKLQSLY